MPYSVGSTPTLSTIYGRVAQLAEATSLNGVKCGFDSHHDYQKSIMGV